MTLTAEVIVAMQGRINQLERECDAAAERAQQHQIDMQALRLQAGLSVDDQTAGDEMSQRQTIRVATMRDQIDQLDKIVAQKQERIERLAAEVHRLENVVSWMQDRLVGATS